MGISKLDWDSSNVIPPMVSNSPFYFCSGGRSVPRSATIRRPADLVLRQLHGARARHNRGNCRTRWRWGHPRGRGSPGPLSHHGRVPPVHHFDVPAGRATRVERVCSPTRRSSFSLVSRPGRLRRNGHVAAMAGDPGYRGAAVYPSSAISGPTRCRPATPCGSTPATGHPQCRRSPRSGSEAEQGHRTAKNQVDQFVDFGLEPKWADVTMQRVISWRTTHSQGRGLFSVP